MKIIAIAVLLLTVAATAQETDEIVYEEEVLEPLPPPPPTPAAEPEPTQTASPLPPPAARSQFKFDIATLKQYQNEVFAILCIFVYLLVYVRGKKENVKLMERFYRKVANYLQANFAHIGFTKISGEAPFNGESPSESTYYASGRDNVENIEMKFNTKKRQDLIYRVLDIFMPEKDTVTIDIPVKADVNLILGIIQKKQIKELVQKNADLKTMTKTFKVENMSQNYEVFGESADTVNSILDKNIVRKINDLNGLVLSIHYTDMKIFSESTGHLRAVLNLANKNEESYLPAIQLILYLADKIVGFKISANSKVKALKSREVFNQSKEKEELQKHKEELRKKKEEKFRKEEAWLKSLPPEKQKREEQKRKKKEFNKMLKVKSTKI